jgi:GNAT superfamily N-acetyltransferase
LATIYKPHVHTLSDGGQIELRQIRPEDKPELTRGLGRMSLESKRLRFFAAINAFNSSQLKYLTEVDHQNHDAWVAIDLENKREGIGVARYVRLPDEPAVAEAAVAVVDHAQGRGIGGLLLAHLAQTAIANGIQTFRAYVLGENRVMLNLLDQLGARFATAVNGARVLDLDLGADLQSLPNTPLGRIFKAIAKEDWN